MLLAIDVGNTNLVFAVYEGETIRAQWRAVTKVSRTADEYAVWLMQLVHLNFNQFLLLVLTRYESEKLAQSPHNFHLNYLVVRLAQVSPFN